MITKSAIKNTMRKW